MRYRNLMCLLLTSLVVSAPCRATEYTIDPDHSRVGFKVRHLGISSVSGRFVEFSGTVEYDPENPEAGKAHAIIRAATIDTEQKKRDDHLRSGDFLLAEKFPTIEFVSKKVTSSSGGQLKVLGDLTIRGVTKPVTLDVELGGKVTDPWGNERVAFLATTAIDRQDFGVSYSKTLDSGGLVVGNTVNITLEIEAMAKKQDKKAE